MNKKPFYRLNVESPCQEAWENMEPNEKGRHCFACAKNVVDFTQMNEEEIVAYLEKHDGESLCGRVYSSQMHKLYFPKESKPLPSISLPKYAASAVLAAGMAASVAAQEGNTEAPYAEETVQLEKEGEKVVAPDSIKNEEVSNPKVGYKIIKGKIPLKDDEEGEKQYPALVTLVTLKSYYETSMDENGYFELEIPEDLLDEKSLLYITFENKDYWEEYIPVYFLDEQLKEDEIIMLNEENEMSLYEGIVVGFFIREPKPSIYLVDGKKVSEKRAVKLLKKGEIKRSFKVPDEAARELHSEKAAERGLYLYFTGEGESIQPTEPTCSENAQPNPETF